MNPSIETIERIREQYPMYQRYLCCGRTITTRHSKNCPSCPDVDGPADDQDDIVVEAGAALA